MLHGRTNRRWRAESLICTRWGSFGNGWNSSSIKDTLRSNMAQYTDITILLDRSGSMQTIKTAMESGMKEFIQGHQTVPSTRLSLIQFDGTNSYEEVYIERPITDVPELILSPRGWTPLYDALCKTIDKTGQRLATKREADRPDKVLFLIITTCEEDASREFKRHDAR